MVIGKHNILGHFFEYNNEYFDGILPIPNIELMESFHTFRFFECEFDEDDSIVNPTIKISTNYDYSESQLRDILVHEMIHYYLAYVGKDVMVHHGKEFKKMAKDFNLNYGMNISTTIDETEYAVREGKSTFWHKLSTWF